MAAVAERQPAAERRRVINALLGWVAGWWPTQARFWLGVGQFDGWAECSRELAHPFTHFNSGGRPVLVSAFFADTGGILTGNAGTDGTFPNFLEACFGCLTLRGFQRVNTTNDGTNRGVPRTYSSQTRVIPITDTHPNQCHNDC
jgi:hypothetical protein